MALVKRSTRPEPEAFRWPALRRFGDLPDLWAELFDTDTMMRVEEVREDDTLVVRAELPGIDPDRDVEIQMRDDVLVIRAERREETRSEDAQGYRSEFRYGSFTRSVPLPAGASEPDVTATYRDGILEVRVPVNEVEAKARTIPVTKK
jgi:HSP20 family protein